MVRFKLTGMPLESFYKSHNPFKWDLKKSIDIIVSRARCWWCFHSMLCPKPLDDGDIPKVTHYVSDCVGGHVHLTLLFELQFIYLFLTESRKSHVLIYNWTQHIDPTVSVLNMSVGPIKTTLETKMVFFVQFSSLRLFFHHCILAFTWVTYRPPDRAGTISSDVVAGPSILTGAALLTLRPVTTEGAALSTAVTTQVNSQMSQTYNLCLPAVFCINKEHSENQQ